MEIKILKNPITLAELRQIAQNQFGDFAKAVVDVAKGDLALGGELHADAEAILIANGSQSQNLWGINLYPDLGPGNLIEFDSLINIKPQLGNRSRNVEDSEIRSRIRTIVEKLIIS